VNCLIGAVAQLGEHLLCKQGVTGSIPVSSTNLIRCFLMAAAKTVAIKKHAGVARRERQVSRASGLGLLSSKKAKATMFDNEIDWVTCSKELADPPRGASAGVRLSSMTNTRPSTSSEPKSYPEGIRSKSMGFEASVQ
jgi:hypothetical protein